MTVPLLDHWTTTINLKRLDGCREVTGTASAQTEGEARPLLDGCTKIRREAVNNDMVMLVYMYYVNMRERIDSIHILMYVSKNMIVDIYVFIHTL